MVWARRGLVLGLLVCLCLTETLAQGTGGAKSRPKKERPKKKKDPTTTSEIAAAQNVDIDQMAGTWYLSSVASKCSYLMTHGSSVEAVVLTLTPPSKPKQPLSVSTMTRHNHQCWEVLQAYTLTPTPGHFVLNGGRPLLDTAVVVVDTDHSSYAVFHLQKKEQVTLKFYSRTKKVSEAILDKFQDVAKKHGFDYDLMTPYPSYSHCESVEKVHVINCVPFC
ncbi:complement component C8 gamma chain [Hypomesus transpacificus]|uniref:complement component C8 gamma chain n=1 Tax=Hypomesus transpacificus TaxID=137520 RepID=UPI001F086FC2|nr:complement component C8 gamma chain [Hypomesus transpacificus]